MSRQRTVGDILLEARAPYTHMDEDDSRLFYSTMNALLVYANNRLNVVSPQRLRARPGDPCMLYENGGRVSEGSGSTARSWTTSCGRTPSGSASDSSRRRVPGATRCVTCSPSWTRTPTAPST